MQIIDIIKMGDKYYINFFLQFSLFKKYKKKQFLYTHNLNNRIINKKIKFSQHLNDIFI